MKDLIDITPHEIRSLAPGEQLDRLVAETLGEPTGAIESPLCYSINPAHVPELLEYLARWRYAATVAPIDGDPDACPERRRGRAHQIGDDDNVIDTGACKDHEHALAVLVALAGKRRLDAELAAGMPVGFVDEDPDGDHACEDLKAGN